MEKDINDRLDKARALARKNVKKAASGLKSGAGNLSEKARSAGALTASKVKGAKIEASKGIDTANRIITEHPLAAVAAGVAAGALAAYLFPKTTKAVRKAAPKVINAAASASREARDAAKTALPLAQAEQALEQLANAAKKANAATVDIAKAGLNNAKAIAVDVARKAEIEGPAQRVLDAAATTAGKIISKARGVKPKKDSEAGDAPGS